MNTAKFAKLCNTDKRTLFYYDEINLLKPNKILDNGYRDYELRQMVDMDNIKILQACGYTLFEIKDILNSKDKLEYIENGIKKLEEKIDNLTKVKSYLLNKKSILDEYLETPDIKIHDNSYISYDLVELEGPHFFSYINDGFDNRSLFDFNKRKIARLVLNKDGKYHIL